MRRIDWRLLALAALYAAVVIPVSLPKGSDFDIHLQQTELLLAHRPVYAAAPPFGAWWPPLPLLALVPFAWLARLSAPLAKGSFALVNVACLAAAVWWARARFGRAAWLALAAVAVPLQTTFEYLNLNALLVALLLLAMTEDGRPTRAALSIGLMSAVKVFPGVLLAYFAWRRQWRAAALGAGVALAATGVAAAIPWGPVAGLATLQRWLALGVAAVPEMHGRSQSLPALLFRAGVPLPWQGVIALALLVLVLALLSRRGEESNGSALAVLMVLAVFLSPVAHTHYYLLAYPAWCVLLTRASPVANRRIWGVALAVAAILTSGILTVGAYEWRRALHETGIYAWGAVLLLVLLLATVPAGSVSVPAARLRSTAS